MRAARCLPACLLLACGAPNPEGPAARAAADTVAPVVLTFAADWSVTQSGPVLGGGQVQVQYDLSRLPRCRFNYMDWPTWDITVDASVDGGRPQESTVTQLVGNMRVPYAPVLNVDPGSDLALWFHNSDESDCSDWDSDYGRNFHFVIGAGPPVIHFPANWQNTVTGTLRQGADLVIDYDLDRLTQCRQDYNGYATWDITASYRFDGGAITQVSVTQVAGMGRVPARVRIHAPTGARDLETWFENTDRTGCTAWDSAYGANYHFALQ